MKWNIANIEIDNQIVLAPMAGVGNLAFRSIVKQFGAGLIYAEMVSDNAVNFQNAKTLKMLDVDPYEHPMSMQLFGGSVDTMLKAALYIEANCDSDIIDINMGCPAPKVTKNSAGSAILKDTDKIYDIVSTLTKHIKKPITVKMRSGWDNDSIKYIENAKAAVAGGAKCIALHPRTTKQLYTGKADWNHIADLKANISSVPIIGNGDVTSPEDCKRMLDQTGCDAVMIGRGALGNPWLIKQCVDYLATGHYDNSPTFSERLQTATNHLNRLVTLKGDHLATLEMRTHAAWYIKGLPGNHFVKDRINETKSPQDFLDLFQQYYEYLEMRNSK